ncbi:helix-turn-helix domain-containing protein [Nocardia sp. NBC_00403]|uniref:helix-turn-helix domain-containing protein n=1 Tax=Nocardia sp. NBC_00403 TaxID=2975990 RepID=UPI002E23F1D0
MEDSADIDSWVSRRLAKFRSDRHITLAQLADQTGISAAHLSRLEGGTRQPSIASLLQIAQAYGVSLSHLVEGPDDKEYHLVRAGAAMEHQGEEGLYAVLSGPDAAIAVVQFELPGGNRTTPATHSGEEWLHIVAGEIQLDLADKAIALQVGDSIHFDSARTHKLINTGRRSATVLIASTAAAVPVHHPVPAHRPSS